MKYRNTPSRVLADLRAGKPVSRERAVSAVVGCAIVAGGDGIAPRPVLAGMYAQDAQQIAELWHAVRVTR